MRRSRGISIKIMMKEQTLQWVLAWELETGTDRNAKKERETYKHIALKRMMIGFERWKKLAMPSAKQSNMQSTPVLNPKLAPCVLER